MGAIEDRYTINTVSNLFDVLDYFQSGRREIGLNELTKSLKISKNKVFRLLMNLKSRNFIEQSETTGKYSLGLKNYVLGQVAIKTSPVYYNAQVIVDELRNLINETCCFSVIRSKAVINVCVAESMQVVRVVQGNLHLSPIHCTAAGKLLIAYKDMGETMSLVGMNALLKYTPSTIIDLFELKKEIGTIKNQGYATENQEYEEGVFSFAVPVRDNRDEVIGAISVSMPLCRLDWKLFEYELLPKAICAANELSKNLGCSRMTALYMENGC